MKIRYAKTEIELLSFIPSETALRFSVDCSKVTFNELRELEHYSGEIEYYENDELILSYANYTQDFKCTYIADAYIVELNRISEADINIVKANSEIETLKSELLNAQLAIVELYERGV